MLALRKVLLVHVHPCRSVISWIFPVNSWDLGSDKRTLLLFFGVVASLPPTGNYAHLPWLLARLDCTVIVACCTMSTRTLSFHTLLSLFDPHCVVCFAASMSGNVSPSLTALRWSDLRYG